MNQQDHEHLRILSIFHYVVGGLAALFSFFPVIHLIIGVVFIVAPEEMSAGAGEPPPAWFGWFFVVFASLFILSGLIFSTFVIMAGRFLARRKHRIFCLVMGGVECLFMPLGTVLGIFTILVLMRESVQQLFEGGDAGPPQTDG